MQNNDLLAPTALGETCSMIVEEPLFPAAPVDRDQAVVALRLIEEDNSRRAHELGRREEAVRAAITDILRFEGEGIAAHLRMRFRSWFSSPYRSLLRSGLFLETWYRRRYAELVGSGDPLQHFLTTGMRDGLKPNPFFDPVWYRMEHGLASADGPSILHYIAIGSRHGLAPGPLFDPLRYMRDGGDVTEEPDLLAHFLRVGLPSGHVPAPLRSFKTGLPPSE